MKRNCLSIMFVIMFIVTLSTSYAIAVENGNGATPEVTAVSEGSDNTTMGSEPANGDESLSDEEQFESDDVIDDDESATEAELEEEENFLDGEDDEGADAGAELSLDGLGEDLEVDEIIDLGSVDSQSGETFEAILDDFLAALAGEDTDIQQDKETGTMAMLLGDMKLFFRPLKINHLMDGEHPPFTTDVDGSFTLTTPSGTQITVTPAAYDPRGLIQALKNTFGNLIRVHIDDNGVIYMKRKGLVHNKLLVFRPSMQIVEPDVADAPPAPSEDQPTRGILDTLKDIFMGSDYLGDVAQCVAKPSIKQNGKGIYVVTYCDGTKQELYPVPLKPKAFNQFASKIIPGWGKAWVGEDGIVHVEDVAGNVKLYRPSYLLSIKAPPRKHALLFRIDGSAVLQAQVPFVEDGAKIWVRQKFTPIPQGDNPPEPEM